MSDYITPVSFMFFGVIIFLFSFYKKDYLNSVKLNGKQFSDKRKRSLRRGGPSLFLLGLFWTILKFTGVFS